MFIIKHSTSWNKSMIQLSGNKWLSTIILWKLVRRKKKLKCQLFVFLSRANSRQRKFPHPCPAHPNDMNLKSPPSYIIKLCLCRSHSLLKVTHTLQHRTFSAITISKYTTYTHTIAISTVQYVGTNISKFIKFIQTFCNNSKQCGFFVKGY